MSEKTTPRGAVLVVGGGIAGMEASLELAQSGFKVYLVEEKDAVGGHMVQLDKTFPTNDCSMCTISPRLVGVGMHPNIEILTRSELTELEGEAPAFTATVKERARFVDVDRCTACGDCAEACPVDLPSRFNDGLGVRNAVRKLYPQAAPNAFGITKYGTPPCRMSCPAHVNVQGYVALIRQGKFESALRLIREELPLPSICGHVCVHPCEDACRRHLTDEPVAIRALKRFASNLEETIPAPLPTPAPMRPDDRVAIVGSGPAGLTAAYYLALDGYNVTIFEARETPGGMLATGIPEYRLPRRILQREIDTILSLGIELKTGVRYGTDITRGDLLDRGFRSIFLAPGMPAGASLELPGISSEGVHQAIELLRKVAMDEPLPRMNNVVVIGGGNVAMDIARTLRRMPVQSVTVACLEADGEMPADDEEIRQARQEGIRILTGWGPKSIADAGGRVRQLHLRKCTAVFDEEGRFAPGFDESQTMNLSVDTVVIAIGQAHDPAMIMELNQDDGRKVLQADPVTLKTRFENVFAGGDAVSGPRSVIEAVAMGKRVAASIAAHLTGVSLSPDWPHLAPEAEQDSHAERASTRETEPERPPGERVRDFEEVTQPLTEEQARREAERCLNCGGCAECMQCQVACQAEAIMHRQCEQNTRLEVGAVILAPGGAVFDVARRGEYGHGRYKNVLSALQYERLVSSSGPTAGRLVLPDTDTQPRRIAWLQCVGSRDERLERHYCSAVCCLFATKQASLTRDHYPGVETTIFLQDMRAHGKGYEAYFRQAKERYGVRYQRTLVSSIEEIPGSGELSIKYMAEGKPLQETFDMVVLSGGIGPSKSMNDLAGTTGIKLDRYGFVSGSLTAPNVTDRQGIYVAGVITGPRDIPESITSALSAASLCKADLARARNTLVRQKQYPAQRDVSNEEPRIGVFICRCGTNIARVVDVPSLSAYAQQLPNVVHAEENLYTCSADTQQRIIAQIHEQRLNRVVVASCTPRTHQPLFMETVREAGLNPHLFEMANIRDQCSWVHADQPEQANIKARDLVRMAVARSVHLEPLFEHSVPVTRTALVIGGGVAGMTAALSIAREGFEVIILERETRLGGTLRKVKRLSDGSETGKFLGALQRQIRSHPDVTVLTNSSLVQTQGHIGHFISRAETPNGPQDIEHGVTIVASGASAITPRGLYGYGDDERVLTQLDLEERLEQNGRLEGVRSLTMVQCVGSRTEDNPACSRVCCTQAVKNALWIKSVHPEIQITVLYRDIRTYGMRELDYRKARRQGVLFVRFDEEHGPQVRFTNNGVVVDVLDTGLGRQLQFSSDLLVLSSGVRPREQAPELASALRVPLGQDGFFSEAHVKLRPLDFASEGIFLCGSAQGPKLIDETITQARGAASRAASILARKELQVAAEFSVVDQDQCAGCLTCVRVCPYGVPRVTEDRSAYIEPAACQSCGVCAAACPRQAIQVNGSTNQQIIAKLDALAPRKEMQ